LNTTHNVPLECRVSYTKVMWYSQMVFTLCWMAIRTITQWQCPVGTHHQRDVSRSWSHCRPNHPHCVEYHSQLGSQRRYWYVLNFPPEFSLLFRGYVLQCNFANVIALYVAWFLWYLKVLSEWFSLYVCWVLGLILTPNEWCGVLMCCTISALH
jgi:hypothetical protein